MEINSSDDEEKGFIDYDYGTSKSKYRRKFKESRAETEELLARDEMFSPGKRFPALIARCFVLCFAMISLLFLMYIPVYNKANSDLGSIVKGWSAQRSRDTRIYIQPENVTIIHQPKIVCPLNSGNQLFLLVIVASSTNHFEQRNVIRDTWAKYTNYLRIDKAFSDVRRLNLYYVPNVDNRNNSETVDKKEKRLIESDSKHTGLSEKESIGDNLVRIKRNLVDFIPKIADVVQKVNKVNKEEVIFDKDEKRFSDDTIIDEKTLPQFDMNNVIGDENEENEFDYDYPSHVMKIPPKGFEEQIDVKRVVKNLKELFNKNTSNLIDNLSFVNVKSAKDLHEQEVNKIESKIESNNVESNLEPKFKVLFLVGLPYKENKTYVQMKIDEEADLYGDIIQEDFIDVYNNLTLKSVMLLKWVVNNCGDKVRYIMKTDDDIFVNMPNLVRTLEQKANIYDTNKKSGGVYRGQPEHLLIGDLIIGAKPIGNVSNKWYSPRYMYSGRVYPPYLSGTGYVFSSATANALYRAALVTPLFHLEDIYITGLCSANTVPRIKPMDQEGFIYNRVKNNFSICSIYPIITAHEIPFTGMKTLTDDLAAGQNLDKCEKQRLDDLWAKNNRVKNSLNKLSKLVGLS